MKIHVIQKALAFAFVLCLTAGLAAVSAAEEIGVDDFQAMRPVMDLVASAAICASDFTTVISDEDSELEPNYITFFFTNGLLADPSLNITQEMLSDVSLQEQYLKSIFAAKLPALDVITPPETTEDYIGFLPIYVEAAEDGDYYLIGELYRGPKAVDQMSAEDYKSLSWEECAVYTVTPDATALGGYRIKGFSVLASLLLEQQLADYTNAILVEYRNTKLGFTLSYPSLFDEKYFTEDESGAGAALPDGSASFTVKRMDNTAGAGLNEYASQMAEEAGDARLNINEMFQYATVAYETEDGNSVFSMYIVTDKYVFMAQLVYPTDQTMVYSMYTLYLENTFQVDEVSVG